MRFNNNSALSFTVGVLLTVTSVVVPAAVANADTPELPTGVEQMLTYNAADFVAEASALPPELVDAVIRDLGVSGEQYLAEAAAATQAPDVVESLSAAGIDVLGSRMDGTGLVVNIADAADGAVVTAAGAVAEIGEPEPFSIEELSLEFSADIYGGQGYYYEAADGKAFRCSIGFNGYSPSGAKEFLTAGHCTNTVRGSVWSLRMTAPNTQGEQDAQLGSPVLNTTQLSGGYDIGRLSVPAGVNTPGAVLTWGGGVGAPLSSAPLAITRQSAATVGASVCKSGSTSGWTCGLVMEVDYDADVQGSIVNSIVTSACTKPGDSGGALVMGNVAVGVTSWSVDTDSTGATVACTDSRYASGAFPMNSAAGKASVAAKYGSSWTLATTAAEAPSASPNENFVKKLYRDFLGREATAADVQTWASQLDSGRMGRYGVASALSRSDEWITTVIENFYLNTLGRPSDASGLRGWINAARNGMPIAQIASAFYSSPEYFSTTGQNNNRVWVRDLYVKLLLRTGETQGVDSWVNGLNRGIPRQEVSYGFYQSPETLGVRIDSLYRKLLNRPAEPGSATWSPFVRDRGDLVLAAALAASDEYMNLAQLR